MFKGIRINEKYILTAIILMMALMVFVGCGESAGNDDGDESGKKDHTDRKEQGRLVVAGPWFPERLDPIYDATMSQRLGILDTLVGVDYESQLVPGLAEDWEVSEDGLVWTFDLREDVDFHDGSHMDAQAVEKSLNRLKDKGTLLEDVPVDEISSVDTYTLEIVTEEYFAPLPAYLTKGETAPISQNAFDEEGEFQELIAAGPFKFQDWEEEQQITITKNEEYWGTVPDIEEVVYKGISETSTRIMMFRNNELDIAQILPADKVQEIEGYDNAKIHTEPILRARTLTFNMDREPFDEPDVRRGINHAIDREAIVEHIMAGIDEAALGPFPLVSDWANEEIEGYDYDLEKAEELLEEAGFEADEEGYLARNGESLEIELVTYPERAELPDIAEVLYAQLGEIGIDVDIKVVEYGQADELRNTGDFDIYLMSRNLGFIPDPGLYFRDDYHSSNTQGSGYGAYGYQNEDLDEILEKAESSTDMEKRRELYKDAQEIIVQDSPVAFLNHYVNVDVTGSHVNGYKMHPLENTFGLEHVYFE